MGEPNALQDYGKKHDIPKNCTQKKFTTKEYAKCHSNIKRKIIGDREFNCLANMKL